jgi:hypothetical protein
MDTSLKTPGNQFWPKPKKKPTTRQNFIEAIRDTGESIGSQLKDAGKEGVQEVLNSVLGRTPSRSADQSNTTNTADFSQSNPNINKSFNFEEYLYNRERQIRQQERTLSQRLRDNEQILYNRHEEQTKQQIVLIQEEIKKIIVETKDLSVELLEAEKTVSATIVTAGNYHINFFERVRRLLQLARKRIAESQGWLELFNSRQQQRTVYWGQVKKSGTKFMMSADRYVSTQAG